MTEKSLKTSLEALDKSVRIFCLLHVSPTFGSKNSKAQDARQKIFSMQSFGGKSRSFSICGDTCGKVSTAISS